MQCVIGANRQCSNLARLFNGGKGRYCSVKCLKEFGVVMDKEIEKMLPAIIEVVRERFPELASIQQTALLTITDELRFVVSVLDDNGYTAVGEFKIHGINLPVLSDLYKGNFSGRVDLADMIMNKTVEVLQKQTTLTGPIKEIKGTTCKEKSGNLLRKGIW